MNNRRIWFRLGGVLAAAAVCTGGSAVVSDRAQEAKNVQRAFLGAMETQMQIGCYPSETGSPADLTERERTELQTAYTSRVEQYYTEENPCRKRYIALNEDFLTAAVPADDEVCRERYPTFETARQAADSIDDQAYIKEARFA